MALADKLDTLTGFWAIDEKPTGSKDPFALRRAALGVIRLIDKNQIRFPLTDAISIAAANVWYEPTFACHIHVLPDGATSEARNWIRLCDIDPEDDTVAYNVDRAAFLQALLQGRTSDAANVWFEDANSEPQLGDERLVIGDARLSQLIPSLLSFLHDRLKVHLRERGIRHDIIDAILAQEGHDDLVRVTARATALNAMLATEDGRNLTQGLKRASNILTQAEEKDGVEYSFGADPKFAETDQERALFAALDRAEPAIRRALQAEDHPAAMAAIAGLRAPIDAFFEAVQVNTDSQILRRNRLNLLSRIREAGRQIADFTRIEG